MPLRSREKIEGSTYTHQNWGIEFASVLVHPGVLLNLAEADPDHIRVCRIDHCSGGFVFLGFPPRSPGRLRRTVEAALALGLPVVLFEAANRLAKTLALIEPLLGDRSVVVARELTKVHETLHRGTARELAEEFRRQPPRGECTVVIGT